MLQKGPQVVNADVVGSFDSETASGVVGSFDSEVASGVVGSLDPEIQRGVVGFFDPEVQRAIIPAITTQTQRQAQIAEAIGRPRIRTFEGPGCNGFISIWGVWNADTGELIDIEKSFGEVPGECGNPLQTTEIVRAVSQPIQQPMQFQPEVRRVQTVFLPDSCFVCDRTFFRRIDPANCGTNPPVCDPNRGDQPACVGAFAGQSCDLNRVADRVMDKRVPQAISCDSGRVEIDVNGDIICISNNNVNTNTNTINFSPQIVQAETREVIREVVRAEPKVVTVASEKIISELPKTGVPLSLMLFGVLVPFGLHLKKFGRIQTKISANSIWEERQFKK